MVRRVERLGHHRDVAIDAHEALDFLAERGQVRRLCDGAVARVLRLLEEPQVVRLVGERDGVRAEHDGEEPVEGPGDLRDERGHVRGAERDAGRPDDLAAVLLDLLDVRVARRLAPRVVEEHDVPFLGDLVDEIRCERDCLRRGVVERPEDVPAAVLRRDRGVEAHADHEDGLVLLEDRHARDADVREIPAFTDVDLVLDDELLRLATADVGLRLVVGDDRLERPC